MKRIFTTVITLICFLSAFAQGADDACLFSQTYYQGTAKALGMSNAMGAVGGDMTAININPAGMGIYRSNEFTTSLNLLDNYHSSHYYGTQTSGNKTRLSIPNIGWISTKQRSNYRPLRSTQFGIGLTRINDYNIRTYAQGLNPTSSRTNNPTFLSQIEGIHYEDLPSDIWPYWNTYLIDHQYSDHWYYTSNVPENNVWQSLECDFKGRSEEWSFSGSANFSEKLFVGISLNLTHIKRTGNMVTGENKKQGDNVDFESWSFSEELSSNAMGCNAKIGVIYHLNRLIRLGCAFHTPSLYSFDESRQTMTKSQFETSGLHTYTSQEYNYEYTFIKPLKWVGSMAFVIGQQGIISLDAEYTNFGAAYFKDTKDENDLDYYDYTPKNDKIRETYGKTFNFRLGTEWSLGTSYLRAGAAYYGSPFGLGESGGSVKKASCGISVPVSESTTFDFAYEFSHGKTYTFLYDAGDLGIEPITQTQFKHILTTTLKVRF